MSEFPYEPRAKVWIRVSGQNEVFAKQWMVTACKKVKAVPEFVLFLLVRNWLIIIATNPDNVLIEHPESSFSFL